MTDVIFSRIAKRRNSTLQPAGQETISCDMKWPCDVLNPTILLYYSTFPPFNYCFVTEFSRYYYIANIVYNDGIWEITLQDDPMASFRSDILSATCYVVRSSTYPNVSIADALRPVTAGRSASYSTATAPWTPPNGTYVVGIRGGGQDSTGISYYGFTSDQLSNFMNEAIFNIENWKYIVPEGDNILEVFFRGAFDTIMDLIKKFMFDPLRYISSFMFFPFEVQAGKSVEINLNWTDVKFRGYALTPLTRYQRMEEVTFSIPLHPQAISAQSWLTCEPYSQYTLYFEPYGAIPLPADKLAKGGTLYTQCAVDLITGKSRIECWTQVVSPEGTITKTYLTTAYGMIGCSLEIAYIRPNLPGVMEGAGNAIGSLLSLNAQGVMSQSFSVIDSAVNPEIRHTGGTSGGILNMYQASTISREARLQAVFAHVADSQNPERGTPDCHMRVLSSCIGGYVEVSEGDINIMGAYPEEMDYIRATLEGGAYLE